MQNIRTAIIGKMVTTNFLNICGAMGKRYDMDFLHTGFYLQMSLRIAFLLSDNCQEPPEMRHKNNH